jgi:hypothetical protein
MEPWKNETKFADCLNEPYFTTAQQLDTADVLRSNEMVESDILHLSNCLESLDNLDSILSGRPEQLKALSEIKKLIMNVIEKLPVKTAEEQFALLGPLRSWLFWLPSQFLSNSGRADLPALGLTAYIYTVALAMEPLFPSAGASYFASMSIRPIEEIHHNLLGLHGMVSAAELQTALNLLAYPLQMVSTFRTRANLAQNPSIEITPIDHDFTSNFELDDFNMNFGVSYYEQTSSATQTMGITEQNLSMLQQPGFLGPPNNISLDGFDINFPGYTLSNYGSDYEYGFDDDLRLSPGLSPTLSSPVAVGTMPMGYTAGFVSQPLQMY